MARKLREDIEDAIHHVFARGNGKQPIFLEDIDRHIYLRMLAKEIKRREWRCLAYCLMENHVHLLIEAPKGNLSAGMQRLHSRYAQTFNERHRRVGHLFQGRFGAVRIEFDRQLWAVAAYIARNPVEAGLCREPQEWRWGSFAATLGLRQPQPWLDTDRLLELCGGSTRDPVGSLARLAAET